ncbi:regulatory protein, LuxR [Actinokineospora spheciospongiae]|uniref:Regulatory protein, LuxR n=1 Tax=Actinokineospora spheciospongiae TaxID=909613 RepID=W7IN05_9PSEU|nr:helix-turn-helix transcriptional regulator [Actinokineospora spheciospongiae]EWC58127.1 regulatory protein, LuxR [Actinokineospora spheciospongiae]
MGAELTLADDWLRGPRRPRPVPEPVRAVDRWQRSAAALLPGLLAGALPDVVRDAERVLRGCPLTDHTLEVLAGALAALVHADRVDLAARWGDDLLGRARERGATTWSAVLGAARAEISLRQGALRVARSTAEESLRMLPDRSWGILVALPLATMLSAETALGVTPSAALRHVLPESAYDTVFGVRYLYARGMHHLATERVLAAVADLEECGRRMTGWGLDLPSLAPWRTGLAAAHLRAGRVRAAALLADEQLALPAAASRYTRALALRVLARSRGAGLLHQAAEEFRAAGDRYAAAVSLAELSRTLTEGGDPAEARRVARSATDEAKLCGVTDLVDRVLRHRPAAHPEPTDAAFADLSEAEQRVATLAALGHTNKEIADRLHVTVSTVEQHLTRVYRKLGVRRRGDLPARLATGRPA